MTADDEPSPEPFDPSGPAAEPWSLLAESLAPAATNPTDRERLLQLLRGPERFSPFAFEISRAFGVDVAVVRESLARIHDAHAWVPGLWPGSSLLVVPKLAEIRTVIGRLPGGTRIERHQHAARELTYVLDGVLLEDGAVRHGPGALLDKEPGSEHGVVIPAADECLVGFALR
jgi:hypothetical protein